MDKFDDIRPFNDAEIPAAMQRMADHEMVAAIANYLVPDMPVETLRDKLRVIRTADEFQTLLKGLFEILVDKTITHFDYTGLENISEKRPYLFVSNHRDIVMDAMLLQYILKCNGHKTCQITFGSNLMCHPFVIDFGKANKMFRTERGGSPREFYLSLLHMSEYMRHVITEEHESVWIAQRNGRTKDGLDATDPAIIKMFDMSRPTHEEPSLAELNIVPVAVSYEWESCDKLKTLELYARRLNGHYEKKPEEDLHSILTGIQQQKGRVNIHICRMVTENDLQALNDNSWSDFYKNVAKLMDQRINTHYHLWPNNYIAHDLRDGTSTYADHYTAEEKETFVQYMDWMDEYPDMNRDVLTEIFLGIYANPVETVHAPSQQPNHWK